MRPIKPRQRQSLEVRSVRSGSRQSRKPTMSSQGPIGAGQEFGHGQRRFGGGARTRPGARFERGAPRLAGNWRQSTRFARLRPLCGRRRPHPAACRFAPRRRRDRRQDRLLASRQRPARRFVLARNSPRRRAAPVRPDPLVDEQRARRQRHSRRGRGAGAQRRGIVARPRLDASRHVARLPMRVRRSNVRWRSIRARPRLARAGAGRQRARGLRDRRTRIRRGAAPRPAALRSRFRPRPAVLRAAALRGSGRALASRDRRRRPARARSTPDSARHCSSPATSPALRAKWRPRSPAASA